MFDFEKQERERLLAKGFSNSDCDFIIKFNRAQRDFNCLSQSNKTIKLNTTSICPDELRA